MCNYVKYISFAKGIGEEAVKQLLSSSDWRFYGALSKDLRVQNTAFVWLKCDLAQPDNIYRIHEKIVESSIELLVSNSSLRRYFFS
jgi:hypothetical protein